MSRALSSSREAQWGTACELCDADTTSAYASSVWQTKKAFLWIITTDTNHIRWIYWFSDEESLFLGDILTTIEIQKEKY